MKNFFKYVLATIIGIFGFIFIIGFVFFLFIGITSLFSSDKAPIYDNSVLEIDFNQPILEQPFEEEVSFFEFSNEKPLYYRDILQLIDKAKDDDRIKGISLNLFSVPAGATQVAEIRKHIEDFKTSGKFVYAYGNMMTQKAYYLSTVSDSIFLNPVGGIELKGLASEIMFFKNLEEKYGIDFQVIRHGKYKSAVEPFLRNDLSEANRAQITEFLGDIWTNLAEDMSESRKQNLEEFNVNTDSLYGLIPDQALSHKLVDALAQETEYYDFIKKKLNLEEDDELKKVSLKEYAPYLNQENHSNKVAIIYASGTITTGEGEEGIQSETYKSLIKKIADDDKIKAVVLRVNSGGGSANASDEILFELEKLHSKKPLVISFGDVAASGGYYIAMAGDKIYAEPNTITGSIGVLGVVPSFEKMANNIGVTTDYVQTNSNSLMYNSFAKLSPGMKDKLTQSVEVTYDRFLSIVAKNRNTTTAAIDSVAQGRVWSGEKAKEIGLIDELGSLNDAIAHAAELAEIEKYEVSNFPKRGDQIEILMKQLKSVNSSDGYIKENLGEEAHALYQEIKYLKDQNGILMYNPYSIRF